MTVTAIQAYLQRTPYRPVHLITASGNSYLVPHPEFLTFSPAGRTCHVYGADGEGYSTLDVFTITEVVPAKSVGARKKKS